MARITEKVKQSFKAISDRITGVPGKGAVSAGITRSFTQVAGGVVAPPVNITDYADVYGLHPYIYGPIYEIAMSAARAPLRLWESNRKGEKKEITFGAAYKLLDSPNEIQDNPFDFIELSMIWMELVGMCYWVLDTRSGQWKDQMDVSELELWCIRPDLMYPIIDSNRVVRGYEFRPESGDKIILHPSRVFPFRYADPKNLLGGMAPTKPAELSIEQDLYAMGWNKNFLRKGANPDIIISIKERVGKDKKEEMVDQWVDSYQGVENWPGIAVLDGDATVEKLTLTPRDAEWPSLRKMNREELLTVWGVPPTMLGLYVEGVNRSVADIQRTSFWEDTMMPKLLKFQTNITYKFIRRLHPDRKWKAEFDLRTIPALEQSRSDRDLRWRANIIAGMSTINEYRKYVGDPLLDWGDERWTNTNTGGVQNTGPQPQNQGTPEASVTDTSGTGGNRIISPDDELNIAKMGGLDSEQCKVLLNS